MLNNENKINKLLDKLPLTTDTTSMSETTDTNYGGTSGDGDGDSTSEIWANIKTYLMKLIDYDKISEVGTQKFLYERNKYSIFYFSLWVLFSVLAIIFTIIFAIFNIKKYKSLIHYLAIFGPPLGELLYRQLYINNIALKNNWDFPNILSFGIPNKNKSYVNVDEAKAANKEQKQMGVTGVSIKLAKHTLDSEEYPPLKSTSSSPELDLVYAPWSYLVSFIPILGPIISRILILSNEEIKTELIKSHKNSGPEDVELVVIPPEYPENDIISTETETGTETPL